MFMRASNQPWTFQDYINSYYGIHCIDLFLKVLAERTKRKNTWLQAERYRSTAPGTCIDNLHLNTEGTLLNLVGQACSAVWSRREKASDWQSIVDSTRFFAFAMMTGSWTRKSAMKTWKQVSDGKFCEMNGTSSDIGNLWSWRSPEVKMSCFRCISEFTWLIKPLLQLLLMRVMMIWLTDLRQGSVPSQTPSPGDHCIGVANRKIRTTIQRLRLLLSPIRSTIGCQNSSVDSSSMLNF